MLVVALVAVLGLGGWLLAGTSPSPARAANADLPPVRMASAPADLASPVAAVRETQQHGSAGSKDRALDGWVDTIAGRTGLPDEALRGYARAELTLRDEDPACHLSWVTLAGMGQAATVRGAGTQYTSPDVTKAAPALAAARSLCAGNRDMSTSAGWWAGIRSVHPQDLYVERVLAYADLYGTLASGDEDALPDQRAVKAVRFAIQQLGLPYVWGGNGPGHGQAGFDCSGLTHAAYAEAGIGLPRTADAQYRAIAPVRGEHPRLGDLVFYGDPGTVIHHVGIYLGNGQMINAPDFGLAVQIGPVRRPGGDYVGAGRPAA